MKQCCMSFIYVIYILCTSLIVIAHSHHFTHSQAFRARGNAPVSGPLDIIHPRHHYVTPLFDVRIVIGFTAS